MEGASGNGWLRSSKLAMEERRIREQSSASGSAIGGEGGRVAKSDTRLDAIDLSPEIGQLIAFAQRMSAEQMAALAEMLDEALVAWQSGNLDRLHELADTEDGTKPQLLATICALACTSARVMAKLKASGVTVDAVAKAEMIPMRGGPRA